MKYLKYLLWPFGILYDLFTRFRNHLYNIEYKKSFSFDTRVISIGNLAVGGTGKTPLIEYLVRLLHKDYKVTTLSRGYLRKTKGFRIINEEDNSFTAGDEPYQFFLKFKDKIHVTVGEDRVLAIPSILHEFPDNQVILLDDAFQHRSVIPDLNIMLTEYRRPFFRDHVLPVGRLRESRKSAKRADIVVVSKCDPEVSEKEKRLYEREISKYTKPDIEIYFSGIRYLPPKPVFPENQASFSGKVLLFTGIANPVQLEEYINDQFELIDSFRFSDHHQYNERDIKKLMKAYNTRNSNDISLLTSEKDMVRVRSLKFNSGFESLPIFYIPIEIYFLENGKTFDNHILSLFRN